MSKTTTPAVKYVIVERKNLSGRYVALRGLSFGTEAEARKHITEKFNPRYAERLSVEPRKVEADDTSERMTCQVCGRKYLARMGSMTHHGYERPGGGWQTASCAGAKKAPFEHDHKVLDRVIVSLAEQAKTLRKDAAETKADKREVSARVTNYDVETTSRWAQRPQVTLSFTKDTYETVAAQYPKTFRSTMSGYEAARDNQAARMLRDAKGCEDFRKDCIARRETWKHTHNYSKTAKEWVPV